MDHAVSAGLRLLRLIFRIWIAALIFLPVQAGARNTIFYPAPGLPQDHHYLVPVLGAQTPAGAAIMYECLIKTHPFMSVGVFHFKNVSMASVSVPYVIANASYATLPEAQQALTDLRATVDYNKVLECLKLSGNADVRASEVTSFTLIPTYASLLKMGLVVPLKHPPNFDVAELTRRTPLAPFDGIGHSAYAPNTSTASAVIHYRPMASADESLILLNDYQARFPGVHFAVLQHGRVYYLTMAAMTSQKMLTEALLEARRRGLYEFGQVDAIPPTVTTGSVQEILTFKPLIPHDKVESPHFDVLTIGAAPRILERESLFEAPTDRVKRCVQEAIRDNQKRPGKPEISVEQVSSCSGIVLTSKMLTRCVLESDCIGPHVPIGILQKPLEVAKQCLSQRVLADGAMAPGAQCAGAKDGDACVLNLRQAAAATCLSTTLDTAFVQLMEAGGMKDCLASGTAASCPSRAQIEATLCAQSFAKSACADRAKLEEISDRIASVVGCIKDSSCEAVVPRFGYTPAQLSSDIALMGQIAQATISVDPGGIDFLNKDQTKIVAEFKACQDKRNAKDPGAEACFVNLGLNDQEKAAYACVENAGADRDKQFQCAIDKNKAVAAGVNQAKCLRDAGADPATLDAAKLATCTGLDVAQAKATLENTAAKVDCARQQVSPLDVAEKCIDSVPPTVKATLVCARLARNGAAVDQLANSCLPAGTADKAATAACLVSAATDAERLACVPDFMGSIDPKVQGALACASSLASTSDPAQALVACVPASGKTAAEIAKAAECLSKASTQVEQAACVATGVGADPKTVATVTCLAKSGGDNEAMVACAAGAALPPNVAKVASCASESTGETDFAICASGLKMSPEWRIAAECAAESGGVPVTFAGCTAGRLTVRELQKCLSGQIGTEGGCFGPSNDVVKAINTVGNDLTHGLGDNNDIRVALGKVTEPFKTLVNGFVDGVQHAAQQVGNAVGGAAHWVGCRIGIGC
ncbi:hypothetical protein G3N96_17015 [Burkholderia sp. Se-20373]|uniref:hypothetical protein n=1 Tax=Burkholderia sp. Se-20373 TaxID=2703898 RepID=UPI00198051F1|nr:hypothetical protein [Burkholderia sp. Se-20373]MBN3747119.1 hypothetical protein [Burkholderia sp. Se-20373]